jgi:hypothetical protein
VWVGDFATLVLQSAVNAFVVSVPRLEISMPSLEQNEVAVVVEEQRTRAEDV